MFELEKKNTRAIFGEVLLEYARKDENIFFVGGDSTDSMKALEMQDEFPDRTLNMGIAEQNTMDVAAGLATLGKKVVVGGFAPFMTMRAIEQFRTFIAYPKLNVLVGGGMGGTSAATEGVSHQGLEDCGIMRMIPNTVVTAPCDCTSTRAVMKALMEHDGPAYIRLGKTPFKKVYDDFTFEIGKANELKDGGDVTIIAAGAVVPNALQAAEELEKEGISVKVIDMCCIKPIDKEAIIAAAEKTGAIVSAEDHQINGGLGSAVAEVLAENKPVPMKRVGIPDMFTRSGEHYALLDRYGMSVQDIIIAAKEVISRK